MSARTSDNKKLLDALATLESALESPFVEGELESWVQNAHAALQRVDPLLRHQIAEVNTPLLDEIETEDPGLIARVEQMRECDEKCLSELNSLNRTFETLSDLVDDIEPNETKLKSQLDDLVQRGLKFVIQVRTQLVALRTWLQEAFDRDRGTVD